MYVEAILSEAGYFLGEPPKPLAAYVPAVRAGNHVYTSGQLPLQDGNLLFKGKVGNEVTEEQAYEAAKQAGLNCLVALKSVLGDLDAVKQVVKVTGYVNSAPGFTNQPQVINGVSDLLLLAFGDKGRHARCAVGVAELPLGAPVEVELTVLV